VSFPSTHSRSIPILTYHQIARAPAKGAPFRGLCVAPDAFGRQMAGLKMLGFRGLSMTDLMPYLRGERFGKVVGITFDDGYLNNLTAALPVLRRHGFTSTCYVVSQLLGQTNLWDREGGVGQTSLMDAPQLRQWVAGGQEVGAHTRHHVHLKQIDADTGRREIAQSRAELEAIVQAPVQHFCYPYGEFDHDHTQMARDAGYLSATTTRRGRCQPQDELMQLPRVPVLRSTTLLSFWLKVSTTYEDRRRT